MLNYSSIVVGTDGSESSLLAVRHAAAVARANEARLIIVCAFHNRSSQLRRAPNVRPDDLPYVPYELTAGFLQKAAAVATAEGLADITTEPRLGDPVDALLDAVHSHDADLLVSGNKGVRSVSGRIFGTIPTEITRRSTVNVLLVDTHSAHSPK